MDFDPQSIQQQQTTQEQIETYQKQNIKNQFLQFIAILSKPTPQKAQIDHVQIKTVQLLKNHQAFKALSQIICAQNNNINLKKAICTNVDNYIRMQTSDIQSFKSKHKRHAINKLFYQMMISPHVEYQIKLILQKPYIRFIHNEKSGEFRRELVQNIGKFFSKLQNLQQPYLLKSICILIRSLLHNTIEKQLMSDLIVFIMDSLIKWLFQKIKIIETSLNSLNENIFIKQIQLFSLCLQVMKLVYIKTDTGRFNVTKFQFIANPKILQLIFIVFQLKLPNRQTRIIVKTNGVKSFQALNAARRSCLQIIINSLRCLQTVRQSKNKKQQWWQLNQFQHIVLACKILLEVYPNYLAKQLGNYPTFQLIDFQLTKAILIFISIAIKLPPLYQIAQKHRDVCLFNICLQCLLSSPQIKSKSAQDYIAYRQDIASSQQQNLIENAACKIIESYADYIDGAYAKIITVMLNFIQLQLTANPNYGKQIPQQLFQSNFFKNSQNCLQDHIQTALCFLSIVSYKCQQRDDIPIIIDQMLQRRKDYFTKLDLNVRVTCSLFIFYAYYVDNIYRLIPQKIKPQFHQAFFQHLVIVNKIYANGILRQEHKQFKQVAKQVNENFKKIIVISSYDCIQNLMNQKQFLTHLFSQKSEQLFLKIFDELISDFNSPYNFKLAQMIEQFLKQKMRAYFINSRKDMPIILSKDLTMITISKIMAYFPRITSNRSLIKSKFCSIIQLLYLIAYNPLDLYSFTKFLFANFYDLELSENMSQILNSIYILIKFIASYEEQKMQKKENQSKEQLQAYDKSENSIKSPQKIIKQQVTRNDVANELCNMIINGIQFILDQGQFGISFGIIQQVIQLKICIEPFLVKISQMLAKYTDQTIRQQCAFLIMQIITQNYQFISKQILQKLMVGILNQLNGDYIRQQKGVYGKLLITMLVCLQQDLQFWKRVYTQNVINNMFKLLNQNHKVYASKVQQKLLVLKMIKFMRKYIVDDTFINETFGTLCTITYFLHSGSQLNDYNDSDDQVDSSQGDMEKERWTIKCPTLIDNDFNKKLSDQVWQLKLICDHFFKVRPQWYKNYIQNLPIAISNFVKNKVMPYKEGFRNTTLRKIYKVKKMKITKEQEAFEINQQDQTI